MNCGSATAAGGHQQPAATAATTTATAPAPPAPAAPAPTPGVVERASKEISRRIHSLGFKKSSPASKYAVPAAADEKKIAEDLAAAADKLNGNEVGTGGGGDGPGPPPSTPPSSPAPAASSSSSSSGGSIGFAASKMGTIIKGSVMDKVTHVFSSGAMGNSSNKENASSSNNGSGTAAASAAASQSPSAPAASGSGGTGSSTNGTNSATNIPKGAVANGRAKFEAASAHQKNLATISPEKPMRFFGSRSRTNSPMLPVKTPKVPSSAATLTTNTATATTATAKDAQATTTATKTTATTKPTTPPKPVPPPPPARLFAKMRQRRYVTWSELWTEQKFLSRFFWYFGAHERMQLAQVCRRWREVVYQPQFWREMRPVVHCRVLRSWEDKRKAELYESLQLRGFEAVVLLHANDADVFDFIQSFPHGAKHVYGLVLRCSNLSDRGLEALMEFLQGLYQLEIAGCNEITEQGLWSSLHPRLVSVTINDCINVADECICAVTQLLPSLYEFNLQAYHVTDSALSYFSPKQTGTLNILRLQSCWEITNHGVVNIVHTLPNLTVLSLSGCSKITDDGIELIAENLRKLRSLDISWCPRVTDAALEYIACDLNHLEELTLDRCVHVTDIGIGYISTMLALHTLFLRWCTQIRDFGLQHICGMRSMQVLSLAGCPLLTSSGLSNLVQLRHLNELELTNCPGATAELVDYLRQNLPNALVLD